jgi:hypothetical protein
MAAERKFIQVVESAPLISKKKKQGVLSIRKQETLINQLKVSLERTALFTVADTEDVYIDLEVYDKYSSYLEVGALSEMAISSNIIPGKITYIVRVTALSSNHFGSCKIF